jgi:arylsulfatase A-like enzyme
MKISVGRIRAILCVCLVLTGTSFASAYNAQPKLVVIVVIDQFRGDYLQRADPQFSGGFRTLLDHGAFFTNCNFDYANTETAPGHATLLTGAYTDGHGIFSNEWWDPDRGGRFVTAVLDEKTHLVGVPGTVPGASPHNLLSDTLGDELRLATQGQARVFAISLKDRAAVLPGGFSANGAFWIEPISGDFITSSYYMKQLPDWVQQFNKAGHANRYWNQDWKDASGNVVQRTTREPNARFYDVIGATPFANDYEFDFARELIAQEKLGQGPATDLLVISLSANDILGHRVGPDSPQTREMALALDREIGDFLTFLGQQIGLANVWVALSADHGIAPTPDYAQRFRIPAERLEAPAFIARLNVAISSRLKRPASEFVHAGDYDVTHLFLSSEAFGALKIKEADAERLVGELSSEILDALKSKEANAGRPVGEALRPMPITTYFTRTQLQRGEVAPDALGRRYLHSYSPYGGWWVLTRPAPFVLAGTGTSHGTSYFYDMHIPLILYGLPFAPGVYRTPSDAVDLAPTLASLLGINAPSASAGRVLTEALRRENAR